MHFFFNKDIESSICSAVILHPNLDEHGIIFFPSFNTYLLKLSFSVNSSNSHQELFVFNVGMKKMLILVRLSENMNKKFEI